uniref:Uncharacterized protein n=1 Tax=Lepeophtheirus salmonis TaxID=72036 RepID=A0A0K2T872_LEPSM
MRFLKKSKTISNKKTTTNNNGRFSAEGHLNHNFSFCDLFVLFFLDEISWCGVLSLEQWIFSPIWRLWGYFSIISCNFFTNSVLIFWMSS